MGERKRVFGTYKKRISTKIPLLEDIVIQSSNDVETCVCLCFINIDEHKENKIKKDKKIPRMQLTRNA